MTDEFRRYLQQRIELGDSVDYLSGKVGDLGLGTGAGRRETGNAKRETKNASASAGPARPSEARQPPRAGAEPPAAAGDVPDWMKDAPPIPGPGIVIPSPDKDLFVDDPLGDMDLEALAARIRQCEQCKLSPTRTNAVPGEGNPDAKLMVVGEGPGATEDETGRPFVGRAGKLLDDILKAIGFEREDVFIANIVKCRPPGNRNPEPDEISSCVPYLHRQIRLIKPNVILAVGGVAATTLLDSKGSLGSLRNRVHEYRGIPLIVTYHPAALLRNPQWKKPTWDDVRIARQVADRG